MYKYIISVFFVINSISLLASDNDSTNRNFIGINISRPLELFLFNNGYAAELTYKRKLSGIIFSRTTINYSYFKTARKINTLAYSDGYCIKQGVDILLNPGPGHFGLYAGISPFFASYKISRRGLLETDYYPDYKTNKYIQDQYAWGIETGLRFYWSLFSFLGTELGMRVNIVKEVLDNRWRPYYVPGIGRITNEESALQLAGVVEWKIFFQF